VFGATPQQSHGENTPTERERERAREKALSLFSLRFAVRERADFSPFYGKQLQEREKERVREVLSLHCEYQKKK